MRFVAAQAASGARRVDILPGAAPGAAHRYGCRRCDRERHLALRAVWSGLFIHRISASHGAAERDRQ